jgi:hypothetical protein
VGRASVGDDVLVVADAVLVAVESACVVDGVSDGVRGGGGEPPEHVERFLPWNMSEADRRRWSLADVKADEDTS